jgi:DNA-binding transcriptional ArsR family regulator
MSDTIGAKFAALSDPTRRAILARLMREEVSVGDLAAPFDLSPRAVAKHVAVLEAAGLVTRRKVAQRRITRLRPEALTEIDAWLETYREVWGQRFERLGKQLSRQKLKGQ